MISDVMPRPARAARAVLFRRLPRRLRRARCVVWRGVLLLPVAVAALALGHVFLEIADDVREGETQSMDERMLLALRQPGNVGMPVGPPWLRRVALDVTSLGSITVLSSLTLIVAGYLATCRRWRSVALLLVTTLGGILLTTAMKHHFGRARPSVVPHLSEVTTPSFPSGHAALSGIVYLTFGAVLMGASPRRLSKVYCLTAAAALTLAVGLSRVYLGVHYATDVVAGWLIATVWALGTWTVVRYHEMGSGVGRRSA